MAGISTWQHWILLLSPTLKTMAFNKNSDQMCFLLLVIDGSTGILALNCTNLMNVKNHTFGIWLKILTNVICFVNCNSWLLIVWYGRSLPIDIDAFIFPNSWWTVIVNLKHQIATVCCQGHILNIWSYCLVNSFIHTFKHHWRKSFCDKACGHPN